MDPNRKPSAPNVDALAGHAILNIVSRAAVVVVAGILVWGFNRIDSSLERLNTSMGQVQVAIGRLETERDGMKQRLMVLERGMRSPSDR